MKTFYKAAMQLVMVLAALSLMGCGAVAWPMPISETLAGAQRAVAGEAGTFAYMRQNLVVLGWPAGQGKVAVMLLDSTGKLLKISELANVKTLNPKSAQEFAQWTAANGWKAVPVSGLPATLVSTIRQAGTLALGGVGMPSVLLILIPAAILEQDPLRMVSDGGGA